MDVSDSTCEVWPLPPIEEDEIEDESSTCDMIFITFDVGLTLVPPDDEDSSYETDLDGFRYRSVNYTWYVEKDQLLNNETSRYLVEDKLVELGVQLVEKFMVDTILNCVRNMTSDAAYSGYRVMRMGVSLFTYVEESVELAVMEEDFDDADEIGFVGASKSTMESLEIVEVESSEKQRCTICLEELVGGSKATRLPCSHLYHGVCVGNWLANSKFCPLCRLEIA